MIMKKGRPSGALGNVNCCCFIYHKVAPLGLVLILVLEGQPFGRKIIKTTNKNAVGMTFSDFGGVSRIIGIKTSPPNNKHNAVGENAGRP